MANTHVSGSSTKDPARDRFSCTDGERAAFEAGIKLGTIFHQNVGAPLSLENVSSLQTAIREACLVQPFVDSAMVKIDSSGLSVKNGVYDYTTLSPEMLEIELIVSYGEAVVTARMKYDEKLGYPLMWIEDILSLPTPKAGKTYK